MLSRWAKSFLKIAPLAIAIPLPSVNAEELKPNPIKAWLDCAGGQAMKHIMDDHPKISEIIMQSFSYCSKQEDDLIEYQIVLNNRTLEASRRQMERVKICEATDLEITFWGARHVTAPEDLEKIESEKQKLFESCI